MKEIVQNCTISGFPNPRHPAGSEGVKFREPFMRTFAPCFASTSKGPRVYVLSQARFVAHLV
jgi:hypothetical protein